MPPSLAFPRLRAEALAAACAVPRGRVTTYGAIAAHLEVSARHVAYAFAQGTDGLALRVPWHRVVGAGGEIRLRSLADRALQRERLEAEGIRFGPDARIAEFDRLVYRWRARPERFGVFGRGPYREPATPPLFQKSLRLGYPLGLDALPPKKRTERPR